YAKWIKVFFVRYDGNQNSSGSAPATQIKIIDKPLTLETNSGSLERTGFTFAGWSTSADGIGTEYPPGGTYIINSDVVLYAKWEPVP
ncbi:MAG: InlB B-repeat-containing protein, partial [Fibrobacter sp.]|nr:InlB B-repeat-containing protein [Fibrobacter sp.]